MVQLLVFENLLFSMRDRFGQSSASPIVGSVRDIILLFSNITKHNMCTKFSGVDIQSYVYTVGSICGNIDGQTLTKNVF